MGSRLCAPHSQHDSSAEAPHAHRGGRNAPHALMLLLQEESLGPSASCVAGLQEENRQGDGAAPPKLGLGSMVVPAKVKHRLARGPATPPLGGWPEM